MTNAQRHSRQFHANHRATKATNEAQDKYNRLLLGHGGTGTCKHKRLIDPVARSFGGPR